MPLTIHLKTPTQSGSFSMVSGQKKGGARNDTKRFSFDRALLSNMCAFKTLWNLIRVYVFHIDVEIMYVFIYKFVYILQCTYTRYTNGWNICDIKSYMYVLKWDIMHEFYPFREHQNHVVKSFFPVTLLLWNWIRKFLKE